MQALLEAGGLEVLAKGVEHVSRTGDEGLALPPVRAQLVEVGGAHPARLGGELLVEDELGVALAQITQLIAEDDLLGLPRRVQKHGVVELARAVEVADHAHDRSDAAAGADEQQLVRDALGEQEVALHPAERDDRPGPAAAHEVWRDLALVDVLDGDGDQPVGPGGSEVSDRRASGGP